MTEYSDDEDSIFSDLPESLEQALDEQDEITIQNAQMLIAYTFIYKEFANSPIYEHQLLYKISRQTFFNYSVPKLESLLASINPDWNEYYCPQEPKIRIIQNIHIYHENFPEPEYQIIDKTYWIKIFQCIWKRKYAQKCRIMNQRGSLLNQRHFELRGRFLPGYNYQRIL